MINLVAVMRLGTLEWRLFDAVYSQLPFFIDLVMAVHTLAEDPDFDPARILYPKPALLNDKASHGQVSLGQLCEVLGMDLSPLWGRMWMPPTQGVTRRSHYNAMTLPSFNHTSLQTVLTNADMYDDRTNDFVLYTRRSKSSRSPRV